MSSRRVCMNGFLRLSIRVGVSLPDAPRKQVELPGVVAGGVERIGGEEARILRLRMNDVEQRDGALEQARNGALPAQRQKFDLPGAEDLRGGLEHREIDVGLVTQAQEVIDRAAVGDVRDAAGLLLGEEQRGEVLTEAPEA